MLYFLFHVNVVDGIDSVVGVISGLKPALKAEELSVIEALRSD